MSGATRSGLPMESVAGVVEVCARQADELAAQAEDAQRAVTVQLRAIEEGRRAEALGSGCWVAVTLRVLAGSLGELHMSLDEAAQLARHETAEAAPGSGSGPGLRVPRPRVAEPGPVPAEEPRGGDVVVAGAVEVLYGLRHRLGPAVSRSLAGIWICASAARYGEPAGESWTGAGVFAGHDGADCEDDEDHDGGGVDGSDVVGGVGGGGVDGEGA